ncbi:galactose-1-phosphate uridylyltransferase [bacterium]|nr:galactose-1-phosphate uridylyltransferase [bacterium]MBU1985140.1 galactose-1-phosphate uridylyltransferase [bacterium]
MPELRHDPLHRRWVIIASERARRPSEFEVQVTQQPADFCPFCPCNEDKTPSEILVVREGFSAPNSPGWTLRVVPNKYPALRIEGTLDRSAEGLYDRMNGIGAHEIVIETPDHYRHLADHPAPHMARVIRAYRERLADLTNDSRFLYVAIFRNYGEQAGATLSHPHSQLIAMPIIPRVSEIELHSTFEHFTHRERCLVCDMIRQEIGTGSRIVIENERFVVFTPYASRSPFEILIAPIGHQHDLAQISDQDSELLGATLVETVRRLKISLNDPPFNLIVHNSPNLKSNSIWVKKFPWIEHGYHWHISIVPRLSRTAGFEWGTGFNINPTPPEMAADYLRQVK